MATLNNQRENANHLSNLSCRCGFQPGNRCVSLALRLVAIRLASFLVVQARYQTSKAGSSNMIYSHIYNIHIHYI